MKLSIYFEWHYNWEDYSNTILEIVSINNINSINILKITFKLYYDVIIKGISIIKED